MKQRTLFLGFGVMVSLFILWVFSKNPVTTYSCEQVRYADITSTLTVSGRIEHDKTIDIKSRITAYVSKILVESGEKVHKGQVLMTLEAIPDMTLLEEADADIELGNIALKQAETDFERAKKLFAGGSISAKEYEIAQNALSAAREQQVSAVNMRRIITAGGSGRSSANDASVIKSPVDGVVTGVFVNEGETVSSFSPISGGTTLCSVANDGPLVFKGSVDEIDILSLNEGAAVKLALGAIPDLYLSAVVSSISSFGQARNGFTQFEIMATIDSIPSGIHLRSGFSANAQINTRSIEHVLSLPEECIRFDENRAPYVYRLTSSPKNVRHQKWETVYVTLGISDGNSIQILSGLSENDLIRSKTLISR